MSSQLIIVKVAHGETRFLPRSCRNLSSCHFSGVSCFFVFVFQTKTVRLVFFVVSSPILLVFGRPYLCLTIVPQSERVGSQSCLSEIGRKEGERLDCPLSRRRRCGCHCHRHHTRHHSRHYSRHHRRHHRRQPKPRRMPTRKRPRKILDSKQLQILDSERKRRVQNNAKRNLFVEVKAKNAKKLTIGARRKSSKEK